MWLPVCFTGTHVHATSIRPAKAPSWDLATALKIFIMVFLFLFFFWKMKILMVEQDFCSQVLAQKHFCCMLVTYWFFDILLIPFCILTSDFVTNIKLYKISQNKLRVYHYWKDTVFVSTKSPVLTAAILKLSFIPSKRLYLSNPIRSMK